MMDFFFFIFQYVNRTVLFLRDIYKYDFFHTRYSHLFLHLQDILTLAINPK